MNRRDLLRIGGTLAALPAAAVPQTARPAIPFAPTFFNPHQFHTINEFSDLIIPSTDTPGAKEAHVARYLDKLLAASDHPFQNEFARDLDILDRFARQTSRADFVSLSPDQQKSVVDQMSVSDQRPSFDRLKAWTARIYYATKPGFDELNKGGRVPASLACDAG